ncbi:M56 family metallopeptidase [Paenibacillus eucommiae]|uniref:Bla regulator protein BlaR1 n=1 Tax=Paenibacillus eucommiae TaxID=1355755 RepID=A0ABS4J3G9_9BACL|nr:M56 family metallopeptidase [Paenibacillus eucommiae]MBP1994385.1 bla regulator protein BlaR1 [Paenibacillus eucommiae]
MIVDHFTMLTLDFFKWVLTTSAMASLLVVLILLVKFVLGNRLKPRWHYILWLLLTLRLLIPWVPESSFSIFNLFTGAKTPQMNTTNYDLDHRITSASIFSEETTGQIFIYDSNIPIILKIILWIWVLVVIFLGVYTFVIHRKFANRLQKQSCISDPNILQMFETCKQEMSIQRSIPLMCSNQVASPTLFGFFHPVLIMSEATIKTLRSEQLRYIFLHELAHYKRKDITINGLMQVLLILHWFNPILWYAYRRMREDQEIACDARALTQIQSYESKEYGQTIITLLMNISEQRQLPGTASLSGNKAQLKRRITMINLFKQNSYRWSMLGIFVLVILGSLLLTNGKTSAITSEAQRTLEAFLDSAIEGNFDKAFTYVTATGISEKDLRSEFENGLNQDTLISYKIIKFFNDDATHASAVITINVKGQGEGMVTNRLIMKEGIWKIDFGNYATPGETEVLNGRDQRSSLAEIYERRTYESKNLGNAQPSIQPTTR